MKGIFLGTGRNGARWGVFMVPGGNSCRRRAALFYRSLTINAHRLAYARQWTERNGSRLGTLGVTPVFRRGLYAVRDEPATGAERGRRVRTLGGIDALIALQGIEDPVERRRRAVKHGRRALDALDELKIGLLAGNLDQGMLRLKAVAADLKDGSGDQGSIRF